MIWLPPFCKLVLAALPAIAEDVAPVGTLVPSVMADVAPVCPQIASVASQIAFVGANIAPLATCVLEVTFPQVISQCSSVGAKLPSVIVNITPVLAAVNPIVAQVSAVLAKVMPVFGDVLAPSEYRSQQSKTQQGSNSSSHLASPFVGAFPASFATRTPADIESCCISQRNSHAAWVTLWLPYLAGL